MLVILGVLSLLLHIASGLLQRDGTYVFCGTFPEMFARASTSSIAGGINTVHEVDRQACEALTYDQKRFRTPDGTCNANFDLGAAFSTVKRNMPHYYTDETSPPRDKSKRGRPMASARAISLAVHQPKTTHSYVSLMMMQFGQFLDHDTSVATVATEFNSSIRCCGVHGKDKYPDCYEIYVAGSDKALDKTCMEFVRSDAVTFQNGSVPYPRTHFNAITGWVDASNIYGSDRMRAAELRARNGTAALLKTSLYRGHERLPKGHADDCINTHDDHYCALCGDDRCNEQPGLTAIHTVFHLEHNRLVRKLVRVILYRTGRPYSKRAVEDYLDSAPDKIQERMYQMVRKVLNGVWQNLVYGEYLPQVLGPRIMTSYGLWTGRRVKYFPDIDPSISEEFLACAFRFGHTLINNMMFTDKMRILKDIFSTSSHNLENYNSIVRGLITRVNHAESFDTHLADSLVNRLFANGEHGALDLGALNIQRARDHGLPRHSELRRHLGLKPFSHWKQYGSVWRKMKSVYRDIEDVECFPGGTAEKPVRDGVIGETFANIIAQQFHDLKFGDKYFFETDSYYYGFSSGELRSLRRLCFSKILCENADLDTIQANPFMHPDYYENPEFRCDAYPDIDMWYWSKYFI